MATKKNASKREFAYMLFMNGVSQKDIAARVGSTEKTISRWVTSEGWKEKRSGKVISRTELINKCLLSMNQIVENMLSDENKDNHSSYMDQLVKAANSLEKLDKKNNIVNDMDAFMNFNNALQSWVGIDKDVTIEIVKLINRLQDQYITQKLAE